MPDTQQTWSQIQTLLADNTAGAISPQDMRNSLYSYVAPFGGVEMSENGTATALSASTPALINWNASGTATNVRQFTASTGGRLTYTGTVNTHVHIVGQITASVGVAAAKDIRIYIYKNGSAVSGGLLEFSTQGLTSKFSVAVHADTAMSTNDYIELWCSNETDGEDLTVQHAYLFAMGMIVSS